MGNYSRAGVGAAQRGGRTKPWVRGGITQCPVTDLMDLFISVKEMASLSGKAILPPDVAREGHHIMLCRPFR